MIVFLTANKISSFGVRDEEGEEKRGVGVMGAVREKEIYRNRRVHREERWTDGARLHLGRAGGRRGGSSHRPCRRSSKRGNVYFPR